MSKFDELFLKNSYKVVPSYENLESNEKLRKNEVREFRNIYQKIMNFEDVNEYFFFKHEWTSKNDTDIYIFFNSLMIEIYCLMSNIKYDYIMNIRQNNIIKHKGVEIHPDMLINIVSENSIMRKGDSVEFKIRNGLLTAYTKGQLLALKEHYQNIQNLYYKEVLNDTENKFCILVVFDSSVLNIMTKEYNVQLGNYWMIDLYYELSRYLIRKSKTNKVLYFKMNKKNNMNKVIDHVTEEYCDTGNFLYDKLEEGWNKMKRNIEEDGIVFLEDRSVFETFMENENKIQRLLNDKIIENIQLPLNNINKNMCKVDKLAESYKEYEKQKPTIFVEHLFERTENRKKSNSIFGHSAKYLVDYPVHGLILKKEENFEQKIKKIFEENWRKMEEFYTPFYEELNLLNKKEEEDTEEEKDRRNLCIENLRNKHTLNIVRRIIRLQEMTRTQKKEMETLNNEISVLKSYIQKEANLVGITNKKLTTELEEKKEKLRRVRKMVNADIKKVDDKTKMNKKGYLDISDTNMMNLGINIKKKGILTGVSKNPDTKEEVTISEKTYEKTKIYDDHIEFKEENILENIKKSIESIDDSTISHYWPSFIAKNPYQNDIDKLSNILLEKTYDKLNKIEKNWIIKYNIIKYIIFKQMSLIAPFSTGKTVSSNSFAGKQVDDLNMYMIATPYPNSETAGIYILITEHDGIYEQECEAGVYFPSDTAGKYLRVSMGTRAKAHEHKDFEKILSCIIGLKLVKDNFEMGESVLFDSFFLRFNRELVKLFEHVNIIMKNSFCDHTLGKVDMIDELKGLHVKDIRIKRVIVNVNAKYKEMVDEIKRQDILREFSFKDAVFGFSIKNLQAYMSLVYCPTYFPKEDGFQGVIILCNFLKKDIEQNNEYESGPFEFSKSIQNNFYMGDTYNNCVARCFKNNEDYRMTCYNPYLILWQCFKTIKDGNPKEDSKIRDESLMNSSSSSSTKEYLFNISEKIVKKILGIENIEASISDLLKEAFEEREENYKSGNKVSILKIILKVVKKYNLTETQKIKVTSAIERQLKRNKLFIYDIKLPESNMNAASLLFEKITGDPEIRKKIVEKGIYSEREVIELRIDDMKTSDLVLLTLSKDMSEEYQKIFCVLDSFPKLQRGFNKRLIYQMFNNPVGTLFSNVDKGFIPMLERSNVDIITKPGAKKYELLEKMATETMIMEMISFFIVDQKRYGDKYSVEALMLHIYFWHLLGYLTKNETIYVLEVISILNNRGTIVPEKMANKIRELMNMSEDDKKEFESRNKRLYDDLTFIITGLLTDAEKEMVKQNMDGVELNLMIRKRVGFVLGVFNVLGSAASDGIAQVFISTTTSLCKNLRTKAKTQSDDVLYCFGVVLQDIVEKEVTTDQIKNMFNEVLLVSGNRQYITNEKGERIDSTVFIKALWAILLQIQLGTSQTFSPKKTAFSNFIGEILQTLVVKSKSISPWNKDMTTLGNSMFFSSMVKDYSGVLGNVYSLYLTGAPNQIINDIMILGQYLVRFFYRIEKKVTDKHLSRPLEIGGMFYIYPDLLKIHGFFGNYIRLLSLAENKNTFFILCNSLNNNTIHIKKQRIVDSKSSIDFQNNKKIVDDSTDQNYAGSCFKDLRIRKTGNNYVKESLYTHFYKNINEIIISSLNNIAVLKKMKVDVLRLLVVFKRISMRKDIYIKEIVLKMMDELLGDVEIQKEFIDTKNIKSFINSIMKEIEQILSIPLKINNLPFLKQITFLAKYLKESFQEGYLKENHNINRRHLVNFSKWKVLNIMSEEVKKILSMNEENYGIQDLMKVPVKLSKVNFCFKESSDFINMNIDIFEKEIAYIKNIEISDVKEEKILVNRDQNMRWIETKETLGFNNNSYDITDILFTIFQEEVLLLERSKTSVIEKKPFLVVDKGFDREVERIKALLDKYKMLNSKIIDSIELLKRLLTGQLKYKTYRTYDLEKIRVFDNSIYNFSCNTNINAKINEIKTTSSKVRSSDLNNSNYIISDILAGSTMLKNDNVEKIIIEKQVVLRDDVIRMLNDTEFEMRHSYTVEWLSGTKEKSFNFYSYMGKENFHCFMFNKTDYTRLTKRKKGVKIVSTKNDIEQILREAYLISVSLYDDKPYISVGNISVVKQEERKKDKIYSFLISNGKIATSNNNDGNIDFFISVPNNMETKFNKKVPIMEKIDIYKNVESVKERKVKRGKKTIIEKTVIRKSEKKEESIQTDWLYIGQIGVFENNVIKMIDLKVLDNLLEKNYTKGKKEKLDQLYEERRNIGGKISELLSKRNEYRDLQRRNNEKIDFKRYTDDLTILYDKRQEINEEIVTTKKIGLDVMEELYKTRLKKYLDNDFCLAVFKKIRETKKKLRLFSNVRIVNAYRQILFNDIKIVYKDNTERLLENGLDETDNDFLIEMEEKVNNIENLNNISRLVEVVEFFCFGSIDFERICYDKIFKKMFIHRCCNIKSDIFNSFVSFFIGEINNIKTTNGVMHNTVEDTIQEVVEYKDESKEEVSNTSEEEDENNEKEDSENNEDEEQIEVIETIMWGDLVDDDEEETTKREEGDKNIIKSTYMTNQNNEIMLIGLYNELFKTESKLMLEKGWRNFKDIEIEEMVFSENELMNEIFKVLNTGFDVDDDNFKIFRIFSAMMFQQIETDKLNDFIEENKILKFYREKFKTKLTELLKNGEISVDRHKERNFILSNIMSTCFILSEKSNVRGDVIFLIGIMVSSRVHMLRISAVTELQKLIISIGMTDMFFNNIDPFGRKRSKFIRKYYYNKSIKMPFLVEYVARKKYEESLKTLNLRIREYRKKTWEDKHKDKRRLLENKNNIMLLKKLWRENNILLILEILGNYESKWVFKQNCIRKVEAITDNATADLLCISTQDYKTRQIISRMRKSKYKVYNEGVLLRGFDILLPNILSVFSHEQ